MSIKNLSAIGSSISNLLGAVSLKERFEAIKEVKTAMEALDATEVASLLTAAKVNKANALYILTSKGLTKEQAKETYATAMNTAAKSANQKATFSLSAAYQGLSLRTGLSTKALYAMTGALAVVSAAFIGYQVYARYQEELASSTRAATEEFSSASSSIDEYAEKYKTLHTELTSANTTEERQAEIKRELLGIQTDLNDKYGDEYGKINLVTDAYRDQTTAIKDLNKELAADYLNDNEKGIRQAKNKMSKQSTYTLATSIGLGGDFGASLSEIISKYEDIGIFVEQEGDYSGVFNIKITADAKDAQSVIRDFMTDVRSMSDQYKNSKPLIDSILLDSGSSLSAANKRIDNYGHQYEQALKNEILLSDELSKGYNNAQQSVTAFNEALLSGDDEKIQTTRKDLQDIRDSIDLTSDTWSNYRHIIEDVFNQADTRLIDFRNELNSGDFAGLSNELSGKDSTEIRSLYDSGSDLESFNKVISLAKKYELSVDDVVASLQHMGIALDKNADKAQALSSNTSSSISDVISSLDDFKDSFEPVSKLYQEFKENGVGNFSNDNLQSIIESFKEIEGINIEDFLDTLTNTTSTAEEVQEAFNNLASEYANVSGILDQVTESNADYIASKLEEIGITNSVALVEAELTVKRNEAALAAKVMSDATYGELAALRDEIAVTDEAKFAINQFYLEKLTANGISLATNGDIENIMSLVQACGSGISALKDFYNARQGLFDSFKQTLSTENYKVDTSIGKITARANLDAQAKAFAKQQDKLIADAQKEVDAALNKKYSGGSGNYGGVASNSGGSGGGSGKGSGGGSGSGSEKDPTTVDWIKILIDRTTEKIERLQNQINDAANWRTKNPLTDTAIDEMTTKLDAYQAMYDKYMEKAKSIGLSELYIHKIQNGALEIEDISDENISNMVSEYQDWYDKAKSVEVQIDEVKTSIKELNISKLDNIINDFDSLCSLMDKLTSYNEKLIEVRKKAGEEIYEEDYTDLIAEQNGIYESLEEEYTRVEAQLNKLIKAGDIKKYSEEWYKYQETLVDIKSSMEDCTDAVLDFREAIVDLRFDELNKFVDSISNTNTGLSTLLTILGDGDKLTDGMLTTTGLSALAIYAQQLNNAKQEAAEYAEAIKALTEMYDNGDLTQEQYTERLYEYQQAQWSAVEATHAARDAILQLKYDAIDQEIQAFQELVDIKKEELDAEQALYEYRKKVQDQTKNIVTLEKKIAELSLSDDRADKAMKLKLEEELAEAKQELEDYQREYSIEQQKKSLDEEAEAFEDAKNKELQEIRSSLDKQDAVIKDYLSKVTDNYETVYKDLTEKGSAYNMTMTEELTSPWKDAQSATNTFASTVSDAISKINYDISTIDTSGLSNLINMLNSFHGGSVDLGTGDFEDVTGEGKWQKNKTGWWYGNSDDDYVSDGYYNINGNTYGFNEDGYMIQGWDDSQGDWYYFEPKEGNMVKSEWRKSKNGDWYYLQSDGTMATNASIKSQSEDGYYLVDDDGLWDGKLVKKPDFTQYPLAYARGTKNVPYDTLAWINEQGEETVMRPSDNSLLVSMKAHDKVLKADWSDNLFDFASNPSRFISDHIGNIGTSAYYPEVVKTAESSGADISIGSLITVEGHMLQDVFDEMRPKLDDWGRRELPKQIKSANKKY